MFKRSAVIAALVGAVLTLSAPAHATSRASLVTRHQYSSVPLGDVKRDVQDTFGAKGVRTLAWSDNNGAWIQKRYKGVPVPDQWTGTATRAVADYLWTPGVGWVLGYKTWCVWNNLDAWDCS